MARHVWLGNVTFFPGGRATGMEAGRLAGSGAGHRNNSTSTGACGVEALSRQLPLQHPLAATLRRQCPLPPPPFCNGTAVPAPTFPRAGAAAPAAMQDRPPGRT